MFGRMPTLPINVIMVMPQADIPDSALQYTHKTVDNLQCSCNLARPNVGERADVQATSNADLRLQQFRPGDLVLLHQPHNAQDDPNNKLPSPWRGPYQVRHRISPVVYQVSKDGDTAETSVHLGSMKPYHHQRSVVADPDVSEINQMFLGTKLPVPELGKKATIPSRDCHVSMVTPRVSVLRQC